MQQPYFFDEKVPRKFSVTFSAAKNARQENAAIMSVNGKQVGDRLDDNARIEDGYRFHDAMHYAFAALLGWSPVMNSFFKAARKEDRHSPPGRMQRLEESLIMITYNYARTHKMLAGENKIGRAHIKLLRELCDRPGAPACSARQWEKTILTGYEMFRKLYKNNGGTLNVDLDRKKISYQPP